MPGRSNQCVTIACYGEWQRSLALAQPASQARLAVDARGYAVVEPSYPITEVEGPLGAPVTVRLPNVLNHPQGGTPIQGSITPAVDRGPLTSCRKEEARQPLRRVLKPLLDAASVHRGL